MLDLRCVQGLEKPSPPSNTLHTTNQVPVVTYGAMELHQQKALTMLHRDTSLCYAAVTNNLDIDPVTVTLGIREANGSIVTCDLLIPRAKYDPHLLSALLKQYDGTIQ